MLNYVWAIMVLLGVAIAAFGGKMPLVTNGSIESAVDAVNVCLRMAGIVAMWSGLMKVAEKSGLVASLTRKMSPFLSLLFPRIPKDGAAMNYISTNFIANVLGLGWAATPAGIAAMEELQKLNGGKNTASVEMCTFMIINMSSLQLVTVNLLAYRAQFDSAAPAEIIGPGLLSTLISSVAAIVVAKLFELKETAKES